MNAAPVPILLTQRRYARVATPENPLVLESGQRLTDVTLCYEVFGRLNPAGDNAILVCHALTGDSHVAGRYRPDDPKPGWWDDAVGPGKALDTDRYCVICSNVLGGCQGSTGPSSVNPATGRPYGLDFPLVTVRDMVRAQARLLDLLGVRRLLAVIGGSLGAMQALEWAATYPDRMRGIIPIGGAGRFHPQGIAFNEVQRQAILNDPGFLGGQYYGTPGPVRGLATARMLGMITYRSDESMWTQFGRNPQGEANPLHQGFAVAYQVESYLHYQGRKLVERFDANSYLYLTRAMDLMDLGRGRGSYEEAHARIQARVLAVGIRSDLLFPTYLQRETVELVRASGGRAEYVEMDSPWGHDAFLVDFPLIEEPIRRFLQELEAEENA
ncbi:homoserine O-acetyltransferase MetX [Symbiobacterium thermophilum]|uniref:homoserine O-acetyltransferase MetX n=1 Tax=Symbiobacterium thermophilum TaxID=2734 RepID=UPI0035C76B5A